MTSTNENIANILNGLIETARDGEQGFRQAAEKAKEPSLRTLFTKYSNQRGTYVTELQQLVGNLGEKPATSGHAAAALHRGWVGMKAALSKNEDQALINECEAGEDAAMKAYREAAAQTLPPTVRSIVERQYTGVQESHRVIRDLKHGKASVHTA